MEQSPPHPGVSVQVVLAFDVPAGSTNLPHRTAALADDFGAWIAETLPGVRVRPAVISAAAAPKPDVSAHGVHRGPAIDTATRTVRVDGRPVRLTYREFELLAYLMHRPWRTLSRAELVREVWRDTAPGAELDESSRTVDTHIRRLRVKLGPYAGLLTTVRGRGYRYDRGAESTFRSA